MEPWPTSAVDELPLYLVQPKVSPSRASPASSTAWAVCRRRSAGPGRGSMLVMTRIVPLAPSIAVDALLVVVAAPRRRAGAYRRSRFDLAIPAVRPAAVDQCQMPVRLHRPGTCGAWRSRSS